MKKLITMIAAVGMAFGLFADEVADDGFITGAAFEPTPQVTSEKMSWTQANGFDQAYWTNADGANVKTTAAEYTYAGSKTPGYPAVFAEEDHTQYATINTTIGNPVDYDFANKAVDIDTGLYFDAMVNMTVFDFGDEPTNSIPSDAKLAVFLRLASNDDNAATNFVVYAGNKQMFVCSSDTKVSAGWHRLTVKAIKNVLTEGQMSAFVVYVDGKAVNCEEAEIVGANLTAPAALFNKNAQLFPSLIPSATELAGVSFDGKGDVDDIVVTSTAPDFAEDPATATITWTPADFESLTIGGYTLDATELAKGSYILSLGDGQDTVTIAWTGAGAIMDNAGKSFDISDEAVDLTDKTAQAAATFENVKFEALTDAVDYANTNGTAGTLKLLDEATAAIAITQTGTILDLNGNNVTASPISISAIVGVAITVEGEGVVSGVVAAPSSIVTSGTFDGVTTFGTYNGGKFLKSTNVNAPTAADSTKYFAEGKDADAGYWVLTDKIDASAATLTIASETAEYTDGLDFPAETVKIDETTLVKDTDYTITWTPAAITEPTEDSEDYTITITFKEKYIAPTTDPTKTFTVTKPASKTFTVTVPDLTQGLVFVAMTNDETEVQTPAAGTYDVTVGKTFTVVYAPDTGYEWTDPAETGIRTATEEVPITAPTVKKTIVPVDPEQPIEASVEEVNAHLADYLNVPTGIDAGNYLKLFHAVDAGEGKVKIELTEEATGDLTEEVTTATEEIEVAGIAAGTEDSIEFMGTPGIWYQLNAAATLDGIEPVEEVQCGSDGAVAFTQEVKGDDSDTARFFKITASAVKKIK